MTSFIIDKPVPEVIQSELRKVKGSRSFITVEDNVMMTYIILDGITPQELEDARGTLTVKTSIKNGISFLQILHKSFVFDMPILTEEGNEDIGNALTILLVEENGYIIKNIRAVGLSPEIMTNIHGGTERIESKDAVASKVFGVYQKFEQGGLFEDGATQQFVAK